MKFLKVSNIKLNIQQTEDDAFRKAITIAGVPNSDIIEKRILRYSIDARKKPEIQKNYTVELTVKKYSKTRKNVTVSDVRKQYHFIPKGDKNLDNRPVVVGFGPAGMFCAYMLAKYGYKPIIVERGSKVEDRIRKVNFFWENGELDTECNVQFGEGGAGTFSDGKLNTGIKDKENRIQFVLNTFVEYGANKNILYDAKPHIGTDILIEIVKNMRCAIEKMGGTFYFDTALKKIEYKNHKIQAVCLSNGMRIDTEICVLAIGHSARDTFETLYEQKIPMEPKPFAVGVRVEHRQTTINKSQYGFEDNKIGAANYKLTYKTGKGRGVYSFCMCPGGFVVNASSEKERIAVNGMSYSKRHGENANSAIVVTVTPEDFIQKGPLAGMYFQRKIEENAFIEGCGRIPVQKFLDFRENKRTEVLGEIYPQIKGNFRLGNIRNVLPEFVSEAIEEGMEYFGNLVEGFDTSDVILSAPETRTSSPIRILRDESFQSSIKGLYPAGEGAGYAGGITSAAIDGIKVFEAIAQKYTSFD